jgi:hypothetical protein
VRTIAKLRDNFKLRCERPRTTKAASGTNYDCTYVTDRVTDKTRWHLSVDPVEHNALARDLASCPNLSVTVTAAH